MRAKCDFWTKRLTKADIELIAGKGRIRGSFAPLMRPYLLQLTTTGNFTSADIAVLFTLSPTAQRLY